MWCFGLPILQSNHAQIFLHITSQRTQSAQIPRCCYEFSLKANCIVCKLEVGCCTLLNSVQCIMHCALFAFMLQANEIVSCWPSSALAVTSRENLKTGSNPRQHPSKDANWLQSRNPGNIRPKISNWMKTGSHSKILTTSGVLDCRDFVSFAYGWN